MMAASSELDLNKKTRLFFLIQFAEVSVLGHRLQRQAHDELSVAKRATGQTMRFLLCLCIRSFRCALSHARRVVDRCSVCMWRSWS